jgi:aspartate 1-decarboxylase
MSTFAVARRASGRPDTFATAERRRHRSSYQNEAEPPMLIRACKSKIHRATVTRADLDYVGSITIDQALLDASDLQPYQYVNITNVANGVFWQTYVIAAPKGSGRVELNGPPARHFQAGDKIIVLGEAWIEPSELKSLDPKIVIVEGDGKGRKLTDMNKKFRLLAHSKVRNPRRGQG